MLQKIESYIKRYHMINAKDHIIAGVSGGADSICLLDVLMRLRETLGHTVSVVHVEHGIRGVQSLSDAQFVKHFCKTHGIECHICHCSVPEYAKEHGIGAEEAGRRLRYDAFALEKEAYADRNVRIATAHHMDDNAETMLFYLARGSGLTGLGGIAPVRGDIIRPLLCVSRLEIEAYLVHQGQNFCTDATNELDIYSRNQIRHGALAVLRRINSRCAEHMYQTAEELRELDAYIRHQAAEKLESCCVRTENDALLKREAFIRLEPVLQREMLHQLLAELSDGGRDITREHIFQAQTLFDRQNGRRIHLPHGLAAERVYEGVEIYREKDRAQDGIKQAENEVENEAGQFSFRVIEVFSNLLPQISKKKYTKCFDYDKIKFGFCIRKRLPGDYLAVNDSGDRQKLKKYLVNEKIPAKERERLLLLADGSHIMWVVGYRISSYYKVDTCTRRILEVTFCGGEKNE